jgi:hypothetical protein
MQKTIFYVRILLDTVPEEKRATLAFREERNYPVLGIENEKGRLLLPDDSNKLIWVPMGICRFVKLA